MDTMQSPAASTPFAAEHQQGARRELFSAASRVLNWHARRTQEAQQRWLAESGYFDDVAQAQTRND